LANNKCVLLDSVHLELVFLVGSGRFNQDVLIQYVSRCPVCPGWYLTTFDESYTDSFAPSNSCHQQKNSPEKNALEHDGCTNGFLNGNRIFSVVFLVVVM